MFRQGAEEEKKMPAGKKDARSLNLKHISAIKWSEQPVKGKQIPTNETMKPEVIRLITLINNFNSLPSYLHGIESIQDIALRLSDLMSSCGIGNQHHVYQERCKILIEMDKNTMKNMDINTLKLLEEQYQEITSEDKISATLMKMLSVTIKTYNSSKTIMAHPERKIKGVDTLLEDILSDESYSAIWKALKYFNNWYYDVSTRRTELLDHAKIILKLIDPTDVNNCYFLKFHICTGHDPINSQMFRHSDNYKILMLSRMKYESIALQILSLLGLSTIREVFADQDGTFIITSGIKNINIDCPKINYNNMLSGKQYNKFLDSAGRALCTSFLCGISDMIYLLSSYLNENNAYLTYDGEKMKYVVFDPLEANGVLSGNYNRLISSLNTPQYTSIKPMIQAQYKDIETAVKEYLVKAASFYKLNEDVIKTKLRELDEYSESKTITHNKTVKPSDRFNWQFLDFINSEEFIKYRSEHPYKIKDIYAGHYKTRIEYIDKETPLLRMNIDHPGGFYYNASQSIAALREVPREVGPKFTLLKDESVNEFIQ